METFAFTTVDFIVLGVILVSAVLGATRGLVKEVLSLLGFAGSMWLAYKFSSKVSHDWLSSIPLGDFARLALAFVAIFIVAWLAGRILASLISKLISTAGLGFLDRFLGAAFGAVRGALIVVVLSTLAALTSLPKNAEWSDALTRPAVESSVSIVRSWLPQDWAKRVSESTDIRNQ